MRSVYLHLQGLQINGRKSSFPTVLNFATNPMVWPFVGIVLKRWFQWMVTQTGLVVKFKDFQHFGLPYLWSPNLHYFVYCMRLVVTSGASVYIQFISDPSVHFSAIHCINCIFTITIIIENNIEQHWTTLNTAPLFVCDYHLLFL